MDPEDIQPAGNAPRGNAKAREFDKLPMMYRSFSVTREMINKEARTVDLSFSSEAVVEQWWGTEVLGHGRDEIDLSRLSSGRSPLLMDHNSRDQIGVIEGASVKDARGAATVRFSRSPRAEEIFQDVCDEIRTTVSVGYRINELELVRSDKTGDFYRVTSWMPYEISFVSIPADNSVGVGRSEESRREYPVTIKLPEEATRMTATTVVTQPAAEVRAAVLSQADIDKAVKDAQEGERTRTAEITSIGQKFNRSDLAQKAIADGASIELFRGIILTELGSKAEEINLRSASLGMSDKELQRYSLVRVLRSMADANAANRGKEAAYELEISREVAKRANKEPQGFFVPMDVRMAPIEGQRSTLVVGTANLGGNTVQTDLLAGSFIELLRNRMMVRQMGATVLSGLVGSIAIPKQSAAGTMSWVAENNAAGSMTNQTFGQVTMSPKSATAYTDISRQLLLQSSLDVEAFVRRDLATVIAIGIDLAALHGSGSSNQPTGIASQSGIYVEAGGTNGAAPTYVNAVNMESQVSVANADVGSLGYLTNALVRGKLKQTAEIGSTFPAWVWDAKAGQATFGQGYGMVNGYKAGVTNQVSSALTKGTSSGNCSAIFYGNWQDLVIGEWGELDVLVDPYTNSTTGAVRTVVFQSIDIAVRHATSFAAMLDALTS